MKRKGHSCAEEAAHNRKAHCKPGKVTPPHTDRFSTVTLTLALLPSFFQETILKTA